MRSQNWLSAFFVLVYGVFMAIFGYMGRANFVDGQSLIFMTLVLASIGIAASWGIWNLQLQRRSLNTQSEKRKRQGLEVLLRDLSREDLRQLKRRLSESYNDDGELLIDDAEYLNGRYN